MQMVPAFECRSENLTHREGQWCDQKAVLIDRKASSSGRSLGHRWQGIFCRTASSSLAVDWHRQFLWKCEHVKPFASDFSLAAQVGPLVQGVRCAFCISYLKWHVVILQCQNRVTIIGTYRRTRDPIETERAPYLANWARPPCIDVQIIHATAWCQSIGMLIYAQAQALKYTNYNFLRRNQYSIANTVPSCSPGTLRG